MRSGPGSEARVVASPIPPIWSGKTGTLAEPPEGTALEESRLLVVDTNVALKAYLEEDLAEEAGVILDAGLSGETMLVAPSLILPEFRHALDKRRRRDELSADEVEEIWEEFGGYPVALYDLEPLMLAAVRVIKRTGCTAYDALFVALAESGREEGTRLVTSDARLMRTLNGSLHADLLLALGRVSEHL